MALNIDSMAFDAQGLIPAIVQDNQSKAVLMMAYMNRESLQKTLETKQTWFWSRSRRELWHKGATSGNVQHVKEVRYDCDQDTLLLLVVPEGPACHNGTYTCFEQVVEMEEMEEMGQIEAKIPVKDAVNSDQKNRLGQNIEFEYEIFSELIETIAKRDAERPEGAYTTYLFEKGVDKILKKVGEEASEVIIAAKNRDLEELRNESADLLYHLFVLWREQGLGLDQVLDILKKRESN
jgi:phosphoribosyl-ATP pyrophosphohydrolase/phosphoribosyl-AMP cyclohydrolase